MGAGAADGMGEGGQWEIIYTKGDGEFTQREIGNRTAPRVLLVICPRHKKQKTNQQQQTKQTNKNKKDEKNQQHGTTNIQFTPDAVFQNVRHAGSGVITDHVTRE